MNTQAKGEVSRGCSVYSVLARLMFGLGVLVFSVAAQAGRITAVPTANGADGFGGWNLNNIDVVISGTESNVGGVGSWFDYDFGAYGFADDSDGSFSAAVFDSADPGNDTLMAFVLGKDWPVGEPAGIKVINDDMAVNSAKPSNCIMTTSYLEGHHLDAIDPKQVICSSEFQTHKRYKLAMLPSSVDGVDNEGIDLVFNVEPEEGMRDYQVFQKINNWTDGRLVGFTVQVGFGIGRDFLTPVEADVSLTDLHLSVPSSIWSSQQLATFSAGLFGPVDRHTGETGFFDPDQRAGFLIDEYGEGEQPLTSILHATRTLGSNYHELPPGAGVANQFGAWLPDSMLPYGIFFDDDGNPETDAELLGWYGYNPSVGALRWMRGAEHPDGAFAVISDADIEAMGLNLSYTMGEIDDLVNVGLNYIVTVGDVNGFPGDSFTLRVTPTADASGTAAPTYVGMEPEPPLTFGSSDAAVVLEPRDSFNVGAVLTARVGDADLNTDPQLVEVVDVEITTSSGLSDYLTLVEQGSNRGVFVAILPEAFSQVGVGTLVSVTYLDVDNGDGVSEFKTSPSTALYWTLAQRSEISVLEFAPPQILLDGQSGALQVGIVNGLSALGATSGVVRIQGSDGSEFIQAFADMAPGVELRYRVNWTAALTDPLVAQRVDWALTVEVGGEVVAESTAQTLVEIKERQHGQAIRVFSIPIIGANASP